MSTVELEPPGKQSEAKQSGPSAPAAGVQVATQAATSELQAEQLLLQTGGDAVLTATPASDQLVRRYWRLASRFWHGETKRPAYLLSFSIVALIFIGTSVTVIINRWQAFFFNALERRDGETVSSAILIFFLLAMLSAAIAVTLVHVRMRLQLRWRQWLTERLARQWLDEQRFYRLSIAAPEIDSPEFRIADDARIATEPVVDFAIGLINALLAAAAFAGVLWYVGGSLRIESLGITIPAFLVIAVVVYAVMTSGLMTFIGRPLIRRVEVKNEEEARLRYELVRVRENAESIALIGGEGDEKETIHGRFNALATRILDVITQQARMVWLMHGNGVIAPVVPLLLGAPKYLDGSFTLGDLMQCAAAFVQVQIALNWLVENYIRVAEWLASASRVMGLWGAFSNLDETLGEGTEHRIRLEPSPDEKIRLRDLSVAMHDGRTMIDQAEVTIEKGEKVLVKGESGTGKSTLIRAMAGLWPWGSGQIMMPEGQVTAFAPQRPYIPLGTLRAALLYPNSERAEIDDSVLVGALERTGLRHLAKRLDEEDRWDKILSGGEQQRLAFARLLVTKPDIIILDEATAALDETSQDSMMESFRDELKDCTIISVGHRPNLEQFHDRTIFLQRRASGARIVPESKVRAPRLARLLRKGLRPRPSPDSSAPGQRAS